MFNNQNNQNRFINKSQKDKETQLEKKKLLQSKFSKLQVKYESESKQKENPTKQTPLNSTNSTTSNDSSLKETISSLKKELKTSQDSNKLLKKNIFDLNNEIKTTSQSYNSLLLQFNANIKELNHIKIELETISKSTATQTLSKLSVENISLKDEIQALKLRCLHFKNENNIIKREQHLNVYKDEISKLNEKIENYKYQISSFDKRMDNFKSESLNSQNELQKEIDHLRKVIFDISSDTDLPPTDELLTYMEINLTLENYRDYDKIHYILWKINKLKSEFRSQRRRHTRIDYLEQKSIYGYLIKKEDCLYFSSIQGEVYPIDSCKTKLKRDLIEDKPSKASIKDGYARLENVYEDIDIEEKLGKRGKYYDFNKKNLTEIDKEIEKITFSHPFKILIVGSRNKEEYVNKLKSYRLDVTWHDSYEEHESVLVGKFSRADVIIICTSHTEHASISAINKHDERVELIERDNANTILHRVRYALTRLGIIGKGDESDEGDSLVAMTKTNEDTLV